MILTISSDIMNDKTSRRDFIAKSTLMVAGLGPSAGVFPASGSVLGANDKIRMGFIGVGNRGSQLMGLFMQHSDCETDTSPIHQVNLIPDQREILCCNTTMT